MITKQLVRLNNESPAQYAERAAITARKLSLCFVDTADHCLCVDCQEFTPIEKDVANLVEFGHCSNCHFELYN